MKNLVNANIQTMSSKEIAELTGKEHKNILRDIRNMIEELGCSNLNHEEYQELKDNRGYTSEILLNKRLTYVLVTGYSIVLRTKVIDRWQELESTQKTSSSNEIEYNKQLLDYERKRLQLDIDMQIQRGKLEIHNCKVDAAKIKLEELKKQGI